MASDLRYFSEKKNRVMDPDDLDFSFFDEPKN